MAEFSRSSCRVSVSGSDSDRLPPQFIKTNKIFQDSQPPPPPPLKPGDGTGDGTTGEDYLYGGGRDGLVWLFFNKIVLSVKNYHFLKSLIQKVK